MLRLATLTTCLLSVAVAQAAAASVRSATPQSDDTYWWMFKVRVKKSFRFFWLGGHHVVAVNKKRTSTAGAEITKPPRTPCSHSYFHIVVLLTRARARQCAVARA